MADETASKTLEPPKVDVDKLAALDDAGLMKVLGLDKKVAEARKALDDMAALTGEARKYAEERVRKMFEPHVYPDEFKYIVEEAKRKAKKKSGQDEMACCAPHDIMD